MASNQKIIYVYESFKSTTPNFLGTLFVENVRGRESYSFEYDADWLKSSANYMYLDPDLQLYAGRHIAAPIFANNPVPIRLEIVQTHLGHGLMQSHDSSNC